MLHIRLGSFYSDIVIQILPPKDHNSEDLSFRFRCKCGNCHLDFLQNAMECQCCQEIDECKESLSSELVLCEVDSTPNCVILHPGFDPVCLNRWSLRSAAAKYRAQDGTKYRQTGTETE